MCCYIFLKEIEKHLIFERLRNSMLIRSFLLILWPIYGPLWYIGLKAFDTCKNMQFFPTNALNHLRYLILGKYNRVTRTKRPKS